MEFEQVEYILSGEQSKMMEFVIRLNQAIERYDNPLEGLFLVDMVKALDMGVTSARGVMTDCTITANNIHLAVTEYDHDCEPCIKDIAHHFGLEVARIEEQE